MKFFKVFIVSSLMMLIVQGSVQAATVLSNIPSATTGQYPVTTTTFAAAGFSVPASDNLIIESVTVHLLTAPSIVRVALAIHADNGGEPGAVVGTLGTAQIHTVQTPYSGIHNWTGRGITLIAGQRYWIVATSEEPLNSSNVSWGLSSVIPTGTFTYDGSLFYDGVAWTTPTPDHLVFSLEVSPVGVPPGNLFPLLPVAPIFTDGRINNRLVVDAGAPIAVYCNTVEGLNVYGIDSLSHGFLMVHVDYATIAEVGTPEDSNHIFAEEANLIVSRLTTGEFQVNAFYSDGKPYTLIWSGCPVVGAYSAIN